MINWQIFIFCISGTNGLSLPVFRSGCGESRRAGSTIAGGQESLAEETTAKTEAAVETMTATVEATTQVMATATTTTTTTATTTATATATEDTSPDDGTTAVRETSLSTIPDYIVATTSFAAATEGSS